MRTLACLVVGVMLLTATPAQAQRRVRIDTVRVGFPAGVQQDAGGDPEPAGDFKPGFWTPVYVDITVGAGGFQRDEAVLIVESADADDIPSNYTVPVPPLQANEQITLLTYTKPSTVQNHIMIYVKSKSGGQNLCLPAKASIERAQLTDPQQFLYLSIGSRLPGLRRALQPPPRNQQPRNEPPPQNDPAELNDREKVVHFDGIGQMPEVWFAYSAVDLAILNTSNRELVLSFLDDKDERIQRKLKALADWVRQGGKLVICAGRNQDVVGNIPQIKELLPVRFQGMVQLPLEHDFRFGNQPLHKGLIHPKGAAVEIAKMVRVADRAAVEQMTISPGQHLFAVEASQGLGRVTVVATDLDQLPFTAWDGRRDFWQTVLNDANPGRSSRQQIQQPNMPVFMGDEGNADLLSALAWNLEDFDVPVISFGWVALFILLYILVVGPLDYLFLKVILNRLELTWITFPVVVVLVSALAYFTAYWIKGNDLRINKIDVVDIDVAGREMYGTTWFTVFSPRIYHYTIGLEPTAPEWAAAPEDPAKGASVVVSWLGRPETGQGVRGRGQSLFRRAYDYEANASGLRGVPIQVWSDKSFTASWQAALADKPLIEAELQRRAFQGAGPPYEGQITSRLPVRLEDVVVIFGRDGERGMRCYRLGTLEPGTARKINDTALPSEWVSGVPTSRNPTFRRGRGFGYFDDVHEETPSAVRRLMFLDQLSQENRFWSNSTLRYLDQSWRVQHDKDVAILVGRVPSPKPAKEGEKLSAEDVTKDASSPSRLWLGDLPGPNKTRPELPGIMKQETYVRVFIPLKSVNQ